MPVPESPPSRSRDDELREAYDRIDEMEIAIRRLTAEVLRLKAAGEDQAANRLEAELRHREAHVARDRQIVQLYSPHDAPRGRRRPANVGDSATLANREETGQPSTPAARDTSLPVVDLGNNGKPVSLAREKQQRTYFNIRKQPAWVASVLVHVAVLVVLTLLTFVTVQNAPPMLSSSAIESDDLVDQLSEVSFDPVEIEDTLVEQVSFDVATPELTELDLLVPDVKLAAAEAVVDVGSTTFMTLDAGLLLAEVGGATGEGDAKGGGQPNGADTGEASFFGKRSRGSRFVFLIDNSGSMKEGRLETAFIELMNSVGAMQPDQQYYVVFYSDQAYPMFYPDGVDEMVPATRENKRKLKKWLTTVEMCTGGELNDAVDLATRLEPAAVYVLSDGEIYESRIRRLLEKAADRNYPIHTLGMTVRTQEDAANLVAIAEAHGGSFSPVGINPAAVQLSRARPIRYNRERTEVWGSKIRKW